MLTYAIILGPYRTEAVAERALQEATDAIKAVGGNLVGVFCPEWDTASGRHGHSIIMAARFHTNIAPASIPALANGHIHILR